MHADTSSQSRTLRRIAGATAAAALAILGLSLGASPALAHDQLTGQSVETSSDGTATGITLTFNNEIIEIGSEILVTAPDGSSAADGAPVLNGRDVTQNIAQPVSEGRYEINWRVVSSDGHPIQGSLALDVDSAGVGTIVADTSAEADHDHGHGDESDGHDHGGHAHADSDNEGAALGDESITEDGNDPLMITLIIVAAAIVVIGAGAAVVIGGRRRRAAMDDAIARAHDEES